MDFSKSTGYSSSPKDEPRFVWQNHDKNCDPYNFVISDGTPDFSFFKYYNSSLMTFTDFILFFILSPSGLQGANCPPLGYAGPLIIFLVCQLHPHRNTGYAHPWCLWCFAGGQSQLHNNLITRWDRWACLRGPRFCPGAPYVYHPSTSAWPFCKFNIQFSCYVDDTQLWTKPTSYLLPTSLWLPEGKTPATFSNSDKTKVLLIGTKLTLTKSAFFVSIPLITYYTTHPPYHHGVLSFSLPSG